MEGGGGERNCVHASIHDGARQRSDPWTVAVSSLLYTVYMYM